MMFSVPQFIDVEDKIAGPLTWRQLLWMIGMGATLLTIFGLFDTGLAIVISVPVVLFFMAFAFYKPGGFPMITYAVNFILFLFRPKVAVWERPVSFKMSSKAPSTMPTDTANEKHHDKRLTREKLSELARIIDSQGGR